MHQLHLTIYLQNTSLPVIELYLYIGNKKVENSLLYEWKSFTFIISTAVSTQAQNHPNHLRIYKL